MGEREHQTGGSSGNGGDHRSERDAFAHKALLASVIGMAVVALFLLLWYSVYVLFLLFAGVLLAILLRALAELVAHYSRLSHRWSLAVVLVVLALGIAAFWYIAAANLTQQIAQLSEQLPGAWENFQSRLRESEIGRYALNNFTPATRPTTAPGDAPSPMNGDGGGGFVGALVGGFGGFLTTVVDVIAAIVVILFTGLFLAFDPRHYVRGAIRLVPQAHRMRAGDVLGAMGYTLKWWLIGQGITMTVIAIATWIGLAIIGVPLAFVLGIIAGLFNFIPNFGPLFSMVPATLLALTISPGRAIAVIVMFIVLQNLEGNLLTPLVQRKAVDLPPALGIITQILLGILVGAVGLMFAWPLAAVVVLGVKMLYVEDVLGDELPTPDDDWRTQEVRDARREARKVIHDEKKEE
ncbi:MAG TPA: AI-2E family transporter [Tepidisphaeraceae bacterium]|nr:AI-2E family transporter [Tepidisphaeraceae bacterium]